MAKTHGKYSMTSIGVETSPCFSVTLPNHTINQFCSHKQKGDIFQLPGEQLGELIIKGDA